MRRLVLLLALVTIACAPPPQAPASVRFETRVFEKAMPGCSEDGKPDCATVRLEYPDFTSAPSEALRKRWNAAIEDALVAPFAEDMGKAESPEQLARLFFEAFDAGHGASWFLRRSYTVEIATPTKFVVTGLEEVYTGQGEPRHTRSRLELNPN
ncbi:MAG: hypothetical protein ABI823_05830 [Bryobacteraceae bacterium]